MKLLLVEVVIEERGALLQMDGRPQRIDGIVHVLIAVLVTVELHGADGKHLGIMPAGEVGELFHEFCRFFLAYEVCRLHRVNEDLQLRQGKMSVLHIIRLTVSCADAHDLISRIVQCLNIQRQRPPLTADVVFRKPLTYFLGGHGMMFVCFLPQQLQKPQEL